MSNAWLSVPLEEYEGHMGEGGVRQLAALSELFGRVLERVRPESVAILGAAGGNGLERICGTVTRRVVAIDINPEYLKVVRERYAGCAGLELRCVDLSAGVPEVAPVGLVHAALIFEHTGLEGCLENALRLVSDGGHFSVVLQLPSEVEAGVGYSHYESIEGLRGEFRLIDPAAFRGLLEQRGLRLVDETRVPLAGGKAFWLGVFTR